MYRDSTKYIMEFNYVTTYIIYLYIFILIILEITLFPKCICKAICLPIKFPEWYGIWSVKVARLCRKKRYIIIIIIQLFHYIICCFSGKFHKTNKMLIKMYRKKRWDINHETIISFNQIDISIILLQTAALRFFINTSVHQFNKIYFNKYLCMNIQKKREGKKW